jgi:hypothetical protein
MLLGCSIHNWPPTRKTTECRGTPGLACTRRGEERSRCCYYRDTQYATDSDDCTGFLVCVWDWHWWEGCGKGGRYELGYVMTFCYNLQLKRVRGRFAYTIYGHSLIRLKGPRVPEYCHKIRLPSTSTKSIATRVSTPLLRIHCFLEQRKESFSFLPVRQYERSNMERLRQAWELNNNGVQLVMSGDNKNGIVSFKNALSLMKDVTVLEKDQHAFDSGEAPSFSTFSSGQRF